MTIKQLKDWRKKLGMSQEKFAKFTGFHLRTIQKYELGELDVSPRLQAQYNLWRTK